MLVCYRLRSLCLFLCFRSYFIPLLISHLIAFPNFTVSRRRVLALPLFAYIMSLEFRTVTSTVVVLLLCL